LFVLSGSVLVIQGLTKLTHNEVQLLQNQSDADWQSFCAQLRYELDGSHYVKVENNFLYVTKTDDWRFGYNTGDDFRKSHANGQGYQPMLHGVAACKISASTDKTVTIRLQLVKGGEKCFIYHFTDK
jgi:competence protein ComGF